MATRDRWPYHSMWGDDPPGPRRLPPDKTTMSDATNDYDIFISYARKDNRPIQRAYPFGWVTALRDHILADHRRFSTGPLRVFLDTDEVRDMDDWRHRILGALRQSKVLLVCLSPNYFASEPCRWEWDEYDKRQALRRVGSEGVASVYFVEVPTPTDAASREWLDLVLRGNFTDIRPWFPEGAIALRREEVGDRLARLGQRLWERMDRVRKARDVPGNLRRLSPYFVGRGEELRRLHEQTRLGTVGSITVVHGLGGQGKTELVLAYAHGWSHAFPLGTWMLPAEGRSELLPLLGELASLPEFGFDPSAGRSLPPDRLGRAVLVELRRRAGTIRESEPDKSASALIILDNVSAPELLGDAQLSLLPSDDWLSIVATTRLGREAFGNSPTAVVFLPVDSLNEDDALSLVREHQPSRDDAGRVVYDRALGTPRFESQTEERAALGLVQELGGFALAVEQVAVFLGLHPEVRPSALLARWRKPGPVPTGGQTAGRADTREVVTPSGQLDMVLGPTLQHLDALSLTALHHAALLPGDIVPWGWLQELSLARHPEMADTGPDLPSPWEDTRRTLLGARLLTPGDDPEIARLHRLVGSHLRERNQDLEACSDRVLAFVTSRAKQYEVTSHWERGGGTRELRAIAEYALPFLRRKERQGVDLVVTIARGLVAHWMIFLAEDLLGQARAICERDPAGRGAQYPIVLNALGHVLREQKRLAEARAVIEEALQLECAHATVDQLAAARCENNLGMTLQSLGELDGAERSYQSALQRLEARVVTDIEILVLRGIVQHNLADLHLARHRHKDAEAGFQRALAIFKEDLGTTHPYSATALQNLALLHLRSGRPAGAADHHREAIRVLSAVFGEDHTRTASARAFLAGALAKAGAYEEAAKEMGAAIQVYARTEERERFGLRSLDDLVSDYLTLLAHAGRGRLEMQVALRLLGVDIRIDPTRYLRLHLRAFRERYHLALDQLHQYIRKML